MNSFWTFYLYIIIRKYYLWICIPSKLILSIENTNVKPKNNNTFKRQTILLQILSPSLCPLPNLYNLFSAKSRDSWEVKTLLPKVTKTLPLRKYCMIWRKTSTKLKKRTFSMWESKLNRECLKQTQKLLCKGRNSWKRSNFRRH